MELLTSLKNSRVKLVQGLQQRGKMRRKENKLVLEGVRLIQDALQQRYRPEFIFYEPSTMDMDFLVELQETSFHLIGVSPEIMEAVSDTQNPQGVVAVFDIPKPPIPVNAERVLILDAIREPGNMGTLLRTASASGVQVVILAKGCVDPYNPKVLRAGMGAHFRLPIIEASWDEIARYCVDTTVYMASGNGEIQYTSIDWTKKWALVIGNEAHGAGKNARTIAQQQIVIPMALETESLNAAISAGVILFEAVRQRNCE